MLNPREAQARQRAASMIDTTEASPSTRRATLVALLVAGAFFMENLDGTVIATALPQMGISFGANPVDLNMGITAYLLTLAVFIPVSGWIADRLGARTVFAFAIALFTFSSILCGISNGLFEFTAARILQGVGGAMMVPVGRLVVLRVTEKKDLIRSIAYITWPGLAAPVIGPPTGGFITTYLSWRWIFFLNVPLGIVGIVLAMLWIKNQREGTGGFDWFGFAMAGSACISFMYSLELFGRQNVRWLAASVFLGYGLLAGYIAVRHMRRAPHPLIDLKCLKAQTFAIVIFGGSLFRIAISSTPFLLPLMFQLAFGLNAFQSGLLILAMFAGNLLMKSVTTPVLRRFGFRNSLIVNGLITAVLIFSFSFVLPDTPRILMIPLLFAHGLSRSMQFTSINTIAFVDIPKSVLSSASSFYAVAQQLSMGMGAGIGAMALRIAAWVHGTPSSMPVTSDFHFAFALVSLIALLGVADSLTLDKTAGAEVSGHKAVAR